MKLKAGMYVRLDRNQGIRKLIDYDLGYFELDTFIADEVGNDIFHINEKSEDILKASFNIIDLLEVGDYVNGYKVSLIGEDCVQGEFVQCDYPVNNGSTNHYRFYERSIYFIVTKEQFMNVAYRVG